MRTIYKQLSLSFFGLLLVAGSLSAQCDCTSDNVAPTFTTPPDLNAASQISCEDSLDIVQTGYPTNIVDANCGPEPDPLSNWTLGDDSWVTDQGFTISFTDALMVPQPWNQCDISGNGLHILKWRFVRTWTVEDECGNATTATHYITIIDDEPPVITCPPNVTSPCGDDRDPANNPSLGEASATDNCDTPTIAYADSVVLLMGSCISDSTIYRMWIAEDACGLADTCTQIITLEDLEGPTFDLPADITIFADADCLYEADTTITGVPTNIMDCDPNPVVTYMDVTAPLSCGGLDIVTRTWTIEDACGNISTGDQIISVVDNTPPTFVNCPADITVQCDAVDPILSFVPDAEDNCIPGAVFVPAPDVTITPGFCSEEYVLIRTWTIEDNCGNTATCEQEVQVIDTTLPDFEAPASFIGNDGLNCGDEDDLSIVGFPTNLTDNCIPDEFDGSSGYAPGDIMWVTNEGYTVSFSDTDDTPASGWVCTITANGLYKRKYRILRTWRVEDFCGNFRTRTQSIVITDTTPPEWDLPLPADENVECDAVPAPLVGGIDLTAQDLCDGINVDYGFTQDSTAGICVGDYILERTYTVSDVCDNSTSFVQTITVTDTTSPDPDCPADATVECDAIPTAVTPTVTDNCSAVIDDTFDQVDDLAGCNGTGTITRTWVFDDGCGNTAECVQVLTVEDNTPPTWDQAMPADATVNCQSVPTAPMGLTYSDNCGADNQDPAFDEASTQGVDPTMCDYYNYTITRTWSAQDECGNDLVHTQTITVQDVTMPDFVVPMDFIGNDGLACGDEFDFSIVGFPTDITDNCMADEADGGIGYTMGDVSWTTPEGYTVSFLDTDDTPPNWVCTPTSNNLYTRKYRISRTWRVEDACGNARTYTQSIVITDDIPPVLDGCPMDETVECDAIPVAATPTATDNCDMPMDIDIALNEISTPGSCPGEYTLTRIWTASDICDNSSTCSQVITVQDTQAPDLTGSLPGGDAGNLCLDQIPSAPTEQTIASLYTDNCGVVTVTLISSDTTGTDCAWTTTYSYTVTDDCNNSFDIDIIYTGGDSEAPILTGTLPGGDEGNACLAAAPSAVPVGDIEALYTDNCGDVTAILIDTDLTGDDCSWSVTYTYTIEDECGNFAANAEVTFFGGDTGAPTFIVPIEFIGNDGLECGDEFDFTIVGFPTDLEDNCLDPEADGGLGHSFGATSWMTPEGYTVSYMDVDNSPANWVCTATSNGNFTRKYRILRTWTVEDACGNTTTATQQIVITDDLPPVWSQTMPMDETVECDNIPVALVGGVDLLATDNCDDALDLNYDYNQDSIPGSCPGNYTLVRTWTVEDVCGNSTAHTQTITVEDTTAPMLSGTLPGGDAGNLCFDEVPAAPAEQTISALYMDNCGVVTATLISSDTTGTDCSWTATYSYTVTDDCNNSFNIDIIYTGGDTEAPVLSGTLPGGDLGNVCYDDAPGAVPVEDIEAQYTDNCGDVTAVLFDTDISGDDCSWTATFTYTIEDECGNFATNAEVTFFGGDTGQPDFVVPADVIGNDGLECDEDQTPEGTGFPTLLTDNCLDPEADGETGYTPGATSWMTGDYTVSFVDAIEDPHPNGDCSLTGNGDYYRKYRINRTWTVEDACNNSRQYTQQINVVDGTPPALIDPMEDCSTLNTSDINECLSVATAYDATTLESAVAALYEDNCPDPVTATLSATTPDPANTDCIWSFEYEFTISDVCGNTTTCIVTRSGGDDEAPQLVGSFPADESDLVLCFADIPAGPTEGDIEALYTDNCSDVTVVKTGTPTGDDCSWTVTYTYEIEDDCGNMVVPSPTITYSGGDTEAPILQSAFPVGQTGMNLCFADVPAGPTEMDIQALYDDNCGDVTVVKTGSPTGDNCNWTVTYTYEIEDECGNMVDPSPTITYSGGDTESPTFTPPANIVAADTLSCEDEDDLSLTGFPTNIADNCNPDQANGSDGYNPGDTIWVTANGYTVSFTSFLTTPQPFAECSISGNGLHNRKYQISRVWTVTDPCNNSTTALQTINIIDDTPPEWSQPMPVDLTVECDAIPTADVGGVDLLATDNCDDALDLTYGFNQDSIPGNCMGNYTLERTWTVEDVCGNSISHLQVITAEDNTAPILAGTLPGGNVGNICYDSIPPAPSEQDIADLYTDNCGIVSASLISSDTTGTDCSWTTTYSYTVTDDCNNSFDIDIIYTGGDTEAPVLAGTLPGGDLGNVCLADAPGAVPVGDIEAEYTDNCGDITATLADTDITGDDCSWSATFTYTIEDECGNFAANAVVNFFGGDSESPSFTPPANIIAADTLSCGDEDDLSLTGFPSNIEDNCAPDQTGGSDGYSPGDTTWVTSNGYTVSFTSFLTMPQPFAECATSGNGLHNLKYQVSRVWTVTDPCDNSTTALQTINIIDDTPPVWSQPMPVDLTVECDAIPTAEVGGVDLLATDNCDDALDLTYDFNQDSIPGSCPGSYTLERTWTVEDVCGNSTSHLQTIVVEDTTDPTWDDPMPADVTVECDAIPTAPTFTASDNCTDVTVSFSEGATQGMDDTMCDFYNYTITRTWTATDACNNAITHTQVITVEDTEAPAYDDPMPDDTTVSCDAIPVAPVFTATDNCQADVTVSFGETATQGMDDTQCDFYNYTITRTWVAEDACGNANTHIQIITVEDVVAPILMGCPTDVTINCNDALPTPPSVTASDNCDANPSVSGPVDVSTQTNDGSCTDQSYTVTRTWTAEDACGNTETCAQVVTLIDDNIPVISLIGSDTIELCVGDAYMDPGATAMDACFGDISGDIVVNNPVNTALAGTYIVTFDVSDPCANAAVQVSRIVIVYDHPLLETSINSVIVTSNNDGIDDVASDIEVCNTANNINFNYITDLNMVPGNVRVYQTIALTNATVGFCNNCSAIPSAFTGVNGSALLIDPTMDGLLTIRLRGWQDRNNNNIIDPEECAGDWIEYNFIITAELVLDCPDDLTVASCQTQQDIDLQFQDWLDEFSFTGGQNAMSSNDNLGAPPACGGTTTVTWTVTSDCEPDVTCSATFTVTPDNEGPDLTGCDPSDLNDTHECDGPAGNEAAADAWNLANIATLEGCVTDNCGDFDVTSDYDFANLVGACASTGTLLVNYTVTDNCNNTSVISATFTIEDNTVPDLTLCDPADLNATHECDGPAGNETAADAWDLANIAALEICASDLCGDISVSSDYDFANLSVVCGNTGTILVTYTVTDECNNSSMISGTFTIEDTTDPDLSLCTQSDLDFITECNGAMGNESAADMWNAANIATLEGCATDACGDFEVTSDYDFTNYSDECGLTGSITVTYTVTDDCNNTSTIAGTFAIEDTTEPDLTGCDPADLNDTHECDGPIGNETAAAAWDAANIAALEICATDACGIVTATSDYDFANLNNDCGNTGTILVTYTVTDECSNTSTITGTFTIEDLTASDLSGCDPADLDDIHECTGPAGNEVAADAWNANNISSLEICAIDVCGDIVVTSDYDFANLVGACASTGTLTVTYTVTDDCNNTSTISGTFTIEDNTAPDLTLCDPADLNATHECDGPAGNETAADAWDLANIAALEICASDLCGDITVSSDYDFENLNTICGNTGTILVTYTVTDECNNSSTISGTFTIEDTTDPDLSLCTQSDLDLITECNGAMGNESAADMWNAANIATLEGCATDACGDFEVTSDYDFTNYSDECGLTGSITVTYTVTDDCNNTSTIAGTFAIEDTTEPDLTGCDPADLNDTHECDGPIGNETAAAAWDAANIAALEICATDVCGTVTATSDYDFANLNNDCGNTGTILVTYTVTDECSNTSTITGTFTIEDLTAPDLSGCDPADLDDTHECTGPAGNETAADAWNLENIATLEGCAIDDCGDFIVTSDYDFANLVGACASTGTLTVTYTVTDDCNNTSTISGTFTIEDNTAPDLTLCDPADLNATHECDGPAGNETAADAWDLANIAALEICASDLCGDITVSSDYDFANLSVVCGNTGTILVTYTVTDECNNSSTISGTFTIEDTTDPDLSLCTQSDLDLITDCNGAMGNESAADMWNAANIAALEICADDACGDFVVTSDYDFTNYSDECGLTGSITVTYTVTDDCNNTSTIEGTFAIIDTIPPSLIGCDPSELNDTHECTGSAGNEAAATAWDAANIATLESCAFEICGDITVSSDYDFNNLDIDCGITGELIVTYTVTDDCNNTSTITGTFTIEDMTNPTWDEVLPADLTVSCDLVPVFDASFTASDDCDVNVTVDTMEISTQDPDIQQCGHYDYTLTRTWTATDDCSNAITHTQIITVEDNNPPVFSKPDDVTIYTSQGATCPTMADISLMINQNVPIEEGGAPFQYTVHGITFDGPDVYSDTCADVSALEIRVHNVQVDFDGLADNCYRLIRVVWRVYDPCGNYTARQQYFTIIDDSDPTFTVPADITVFTDEDCEYNIDSTLTGIPTMVEDNCTTNPLVYHSNSNPAPGSCEGEVIITRTWFVVDDCDNSTSQDQIITVRDTISPTFTVPDDITIFKDEMCMHDSDTLLTGYVMDEADNCTATLNATFTDDMQAGSCGGEMIITRTWRLEDDCNNVTTQNQVITVRDTLLPIFPKPADMTLSSEDGANCPTDFNSSLVVNQNDPIATGGTPFTFTMHGVEIDGPTVYSDNCSSGDDLSLYVWVIDEDYDGMADNCYRLIRVLWRVYDDCGNYQPRQQFFTILDETVPTFTAPADITIFKDEDCEHDDSVAFTGDVTDEDDNCSNDLEATFTDQVVGGPCEGTLVITRTWVLEDDCGNTADPQIQIITVSDNTKPTFTVPADITILKDANCDHDADVSITGDVDDEADNCTTILDATFVDAVADGPCEGSLVITRTWTLVDNCGNDSIQTQIITVSDSIDPFFPKPADMTLSTLDGATCPAVTDISLVINQNDPVATANEPFTFTVHGIEIDGPVVYTDNCSSPENLGVYVWNINEDFDGMAGNCYRQIQVIFRVYDDCGNFQQRQQVFTINEETPPVAVCNDVTIYLDENGEVNLTPQEVGGASSDNCDPDPLLTISKDFFTCDDVGNNDITFTIEDFCMLSDQCVAKVQVRDTVPPNAQCKNVTVFLDINGLAFITVPDIDNGSTDACGIASLVLSRTDFFCSDLGDVAVTLTVTDVNNNVSTCIGIVEVRDDIAPLALCKPISVNLNGQGLVNVVPLDMDDGSSDNCGIVDYQLSKTQFDCTNLGSNLITFTVFDAAGNSSTCQANVQVSDVSSPNMACKNLTLYLNAQGNPITIQPADIDNGTSDNCNIVSLTISMSTFDCSTTGQNVVKLIAVDQSGNSGECAAIVTVRDTIPPVWTFLPDDVTVFCIESAADEEPEATDNCVDILITLVSDQQEIWPAGPPNSYLVRRIWRAEDASGNEIFHEQIVYVLPGGQLFVNCNPDIITEETNIPIQVDWPIPFVDDICAGKSDMYQIGGPLPNSYFNPGSETIITYEFIDAFGTRFQCAFWVIVPTDSNDYVVILNEQTCDKLQLEDCQIRDLPAPDNYSFEIVIPNQLPILHKVDNNTRLEMFADGTAHLTGSWVDLPGFCGWEFDIWFHRRRTYEGWLKAGGSVNSFFGADPTGWDFFEVDATRSVMVGTGCNVGTEYDLSISPNFAKFGLQLGVAANTKSVGYGGWVVLGLYEPGNENLFAQGIFSFELDCQPTEVLKDAATFVSLDGFPYGVEWSTGNTSYELGDVAPGMYSITITQPGNIDSIAFFNLEYPTDCELYYDQQCRPGNYAPGKSLAKQSSTQQNFVAALAVDGNTDGDLANGSVSSTLAGFQNWLSVALDFPQPIERVRVWSRTDCCQDVLDPLWLFISELPIPEFTDPDVLATLPDMNAYYHVGPIETYVDFEFEGQMGQYLKVQLDEFGRLQLAEVQVLVCQEDALGLQVENFGSEDETEEASRSDFDLVPTVSTWPSPASNLMEVSIAQEMAQPLHISIVNMHGSEVFTTDLDADTFHRLTLDVGQWQPGLYFMTTTSPIGASSKPILIQR